MASFVKKNWYTLQQAVNALQSRYPDCTAGTLLQLGMEGRLDLSVVFSMDVLADVYRQVRKDELSFTEVPSLDGDRTISIPNGGDVVFDNDEQAYQATGHRVNLVAGAAFKLGMVGGEIEELQDLFWRGLGKPRAETTNIDGTFCRGMMSDGPALFRLMAPFDDRSKGYYPMGRLPAAAMIAIAQGDLDALLRGEQANEAHSARPAEPQGLDWPWGPHSTNLLRHLAGAARRFWANFDPSDISTAPTNEQVATWLQAKGVSQRNADAMATILRADGLPTGPRR